jgi:Contractile injection system tube protein
MPQQPQKVAKATLKAVNDGRQVEVHFNPATLVYSVENSVTQQSGDPKKAQYVAQFSGKLSMDLQFDTTATGTDVRIDTAKVARFMQASGSASADLKNASASANNATGDPKSPPQAPPVLMFQWGSYQFKGIMESFKETIDFFSAEGIALRALVSISLARQDLTFTDDVPSSTATGAPGSLVPSSVGDSALSIATRGGDPSAARQLGTDNGLESLRFTGGAQLQVNSGVQFNAPAGFVTVSSGGAQAGLGISAGLNLSAGGSGALFGAKASAGVPATAGAFAGLETGRAKVSTTLKLDPTQMLPSTVGADVSTFAGASFSLGGMANNSGGAGFTADVGAKFSFRDRLTFDSDD